MFRYPSFFPKLRPKQFHIFLYKPNLLKFAHCVLIVLRVKSCNHPFSSRIINITNHAFQCANYSSVAIISLSRQKLNTSTIKILVTVNIPQRAAMSGTLLSDVAWAASFRQESEKQFLIFWGYFLPDSDRDSESLN